MASIDLETFIDDSIRISKVHGYVPTAFIGMRSRHGTIDAISRLVISGDIQSGFRRMITLGLIDYTLEAAVEKSPSEFTKNERECAAFRLKIGRGVGQKRDND